MISIVNLLNTYHQTQENFFPLTRIFKIYFLSNTQICNAILFIIITMLYIKSHDFFITGSQYLLIPFICFTHSPDPDSRHYQSVLYTSSISVILFKTLHANEVIWCFTFSISFSIMPARSIHGAANRKISFFFMNNISFYINNTSAFLFISRSSKTCTQSITILIMKIFKNIFFNLKMRRTQENQISSMLAITAHHMG